MYYPVVQHDLSSSPAVPHPVMVGFVNGLALVMFRAQLTHFRDAGGRFLSLASLEGRATYGVTLLTMFLVRFGVPKLQEKIEVAKAVPPTLGGIVLVTALAKLGGWPLQTLADVAGHETFRGGLSVLPKIGLPSSVWTPLVKAPLETLRVSSVAVASAARRLFSCAMPVAHISPQRLFSLTQ